MSQYHSTVAFKDLSPQVQSDIKEFNRDNRSRAIALNNEMPLRDALGAYLAWNGIFGYTSVIMSIFEVSS